MNIARFMLVVGLTGAVTLWYVPLAANQQQDQPDNMRQSSDQTEPARTPAQEQRKTDTARQEKDRFLPPALKTAPAVTWTHHVDLGVEETLSAAFASDGRSIYAHIHEPTIDLWRLLFVPRRIIGGVVMGIIFLMTAMQARRIVKRRQRLGHLYCRRCNYDVGTQAGSAAPSGSATAAVSDGKPEARCSECGLDLAARPPKPGRRTRSRLALPIGLLVVLAGLYAYVCTPWFARHHWSRVQSWTSPWLARFAERHDVWYLKKQIRESDRVIEVDLETGRAIRTVLRRNSRTYGRLSISPDGKTLVMDGPASESATAFRVSSGSRLGAAVMPGWVQHSPGLPATVGWSGDSRTAYIAWFDRDKNIGGVSAWNLKTGSARELFRTPGFKRLDSRLSYGRLFARLGSDEPPRFVSWPNFMEAHPTKTFKVRVHGENQPEREFSPTPMPSSMSEPAITPDGRTMFFPVGFGESIVGIDTATGGTIGTLSTNPGGGNETIDIDGAGRRMVIDGDPLVVRDIVDRRWVARLVEPTGLYGPRPSISRDGQWVAAVMQKDITSPRQYGHDLVLWKIDSTPADTADPPASKPSRPDTEP